MSIWYFLAGFLFLFIIGMLIISSHFGNKISFGERDFDSDAKLMEINEDSKRFRISVYFALAEHGAIIALSIVLFVVFVNYNLLLGIIWLIARTVEGLVVFNNEKNYWKLLSHSKLYTSSSEMDKQSVSDSARHILETKQYRFTFAQILFSIGTFAYSIAFAVYTILPIFIAWFGLVAAILYGVGNGIILLKPRINGLAGLGGLLVFLFEAALGVWLIYYSFLLP